MAWEPQPSPTVVSIQEESRVHMSLGSAVAIAAERIVKPVEGMHRAIAKPWFAALGPVGGPVRSLHNVVSSIVYGSIRAGAAAVGGAIDLSSAVDSSSPGATEAVVRGLWGDKLGRHESRMSPAMTIHDHQDRPVVVGPGLDAALPSASSRIVVLVHGLMKTARCWHDKGGAPGLFRALEDNPYLTPLAVNYNTGLSVEANGAELASLLQQLHVHWPRPVESIALVGHSMGGLVVRSACAAASAARHGWVDKASTVVTIGTPHRGAPLEKLVHVAARGLGVAPQTRPLARFLEERSHGIQDLRNGGHRWTDDEVPPNADVHLVAGVITKDPSHPFGAVMGDLLVRPTSGTHSAELDTANSVVFGGVNHLDLLHEPAVLEEVMGWLSPEPDPTDSERRNDSPDGNEVRDAGNDHHDVEELMVGEHSGGKQRPVVDEEGDS